MTIAVHNSVLRVGLYSPNYPGVSGDGGIGTYTRALAESLVRSGHTVCVLTTGAVTQRSYAAEAVPVDIIGRSHMGLFDRMAPGVRASWLVGQAALHLTKEFKLDLFEFPNWEGLGIWYAARRHIPMVVRLSTSLAETQQIDSLPITWQLRSEMAREKIHANLADALVTHSYAHRVTMASELGVDANRIKVIPLGVPVYPQFTRGRKTEAHQTVVFLGRLERRKGALDLLNAIPLVLRQAPNTRFVLIGTDRPHCPGGRTHRQYLENEFPRSVQQNVVLAGALGDEEVTRYLQTADLFVAPSLYESFGLIFLEAMRWGTPVVGTRVGGIPEIVCDGESGVLVSPGNHHELASAISELLLDEQRRLTLGEKGRKRVESHFSVQLMAARTVEFYVGVLRERTAR